VRRALHCEVSSRDFNESDMATLMLVSRRRILNRLCDLIASGRILASQAARFYVLYSKAIRERGGYRRRSVV
jgi:hypothetical protein